MTVACGLRATRVLVYFFNLAQKNLICFLALTPEILTPSDLRNSCSSAPWRKTYPLLDSGVWSLPIVAEPLQCRLPAKPVQLAHDRGSQHAMQNNGHGNHQTHY